jgi:hypothetical protein
VPLLGPPFVQAWTLLVEQLGERDGARVLARLLGGVVDLGLDVVAERVRVALLEGRPLQLALLPTVAAPPMLASDELPSSLQAIEVVSGHARDYDMLLGGAL